MSQGNGIKPVEARRLLVERVASSPYLNKSARLRDLLVYLTERVIEDEAGEIHEQEVGCKVFGRPRNYDTAADNIVRVHASLLRKRLDRYFLTEGAEEPLLVEIPKGNYAPVFRERAKTPALAPAPPATPVGEPALPVGAPPGRDWRLWARVLGVLAALFAVSTAWLLTRASLPGALLPRPVTRQLWSQVFRPGRPTDLVLDDAAIGLYQELNGKPLPLSEYFDRSYMRSLPGPAEKLDAQTASTLMLRRVATYASTGFLWKLLGPGGVPSALGAGQTMLRFAREYSFRDLRANSAILLGNSSTNPWFQLFEQKIGIRWQYDAATGVYLPVDNWNGNSRYPPAAAGEGHEGYFSIALLPNLANTGNVLLVSGTGGSALNTGADFLADDRALAGLRSRLPATRDRAFPYFEALIRTGGRNTLPGDAILVVCRPAAR